MPYVRASAYLHRTTRNALPAIAPIILLESARRTHQLGVDVLVGRRNLNWSELSCLTSGQELQPLVELNRADAVAAEWGEVRELRVRAAPRSWESLERGHAVGRR